MIYIEYQLNNNSMSIDNDMPVLKKIIADVSNSSLSEVEVQKGSIPFYSGLDDSKDSVLCAHCGFIGIKIMPRDKNHEDYVISKMGYIETDDCIEDYSGVKYCNNSFTDQLDSRLQNESTQNELSAKGMGPIGRSKPYGNLFIRNA